MGFDSKHGFLLEPRFVLGDDRSYGPFGGLIVKMHKIEDIGCFASDCSIGGLPLPGRSPDREALLEARCDCASQELRPLLRRDDTIWPGGTKVQQIINRTLLARLALLLSHACATGGRERDCEE